MQIRAVEFSSIGDQIFAGGLNKAIRVFTQTKEQVFAIDIQNQMKEDVLLEETKDLNLNQESNKKKQENMNQAEHFMDLIEQIQRESKNKQIEYENAFLVKKDVETPSFEELDQLNPAEYVMRKLSKIPQNKLDQILYFFHFSTVTEIFYFIFYSLKRKRYIDLSYYLLRYLSEQHLQNIRADRTILRLVNKCSKLLIDIQREEIGRKFYIESALQLYNKEADYLT